MSCARLACATSGDGVTKEPHLSPPHYELNAIQHVLDQTRVSIGLQAILNGKCGQQAWGKSLRRQKMVKSIVPEMERSPVHENELYSKITQLLSTNFSTYRN